MNLNLFLYKEVKEFIYLFPG